MRSAATRPTSSALPRPHVDKGTGGPWWRSRPTSNSICSLQQKHLSPPVRRDTAPLDLRDIPHVGPWGIVLGASTAGLDPRSRAMWQIMTARSRMSLQTPSRFTTTARSSRGEGPRARAHAARPRCKHGSHRSLPGDGSQGRQPREDTCRRGDSARALGTGGDGDQTAHDSGGADRQGPSSLTEQCERRDHVIVGL